MFLASLEIERIEIRVNFNQIFQLLSISFTRKYRNVPSFRQ